MEQPIHEELSLKMIEDTIGRNIMNRVPKERTVKLFFLSKEAEDHFMKTFKKILQEEIESKHGTI